MKKALALSSLEIYFLNILTNFRDLKHQSARKLNPKFILFYLFIFFFRKGILQKKWISFYKLNLFFMTNLIFPLLPFMLNFFHSSSIFLVQETVSKRKTGRINLINTWLILISNLLKYFTALLHETTYLKD